MTDNSNAADTITLAGASQTVKGATLNGDTIGGFTVGDFLDLTGIPFNPPGPNQTTLALTGTTLTVSVGGVPKTALTLTGSHNQSQFTLGADSGSGTLVGYHS